MANKIDKFFIILYSGFNKERKIMVDNGKEVRKQILDVIGGLAAIITVLVFVALRIDAQWNFIPSGTAVYKILLYIERWAPLVVVAITGWEFASTRGFLFRIIFYIAVALIVVCMFFPSTWTQFVGLVESK